MPQRHEDYSSNDAEASKPYSYLPKFDLKGERKRSPANQWPQYRQQQQQQQQLQPQHVPDYLSQEQEWRSPAEQKQQHPQRYFPLQQQPRHLPPSPPKVGNFYPNYPPVHHFKHRGHNTKDKRSLSLEAVRGPPIHPGPFHRQFHRPEPQWSYRSRGKWVNLVRFVPAIILSCLLLAANDNPLNYFVNFILRELRPSVAAPKWYLRRSVLPFIFLCVVGSALSGVLIGTEFLRNSQTHHNYGYGGGNGNRKRKKNENPKGYRKWRAYSNPNPPPNTAFYSSSSNQSSSTTSPSTFTPHNKPPARRPEET